MAPKILCVGFHKTGTTSFGTAMQQLGYRTQGWKSENSLLFHSGEIHQLLRITDDFDCFEDFPWPLLYRDLFYRHPETKFVLTRRKNLDVWFDSLARHCDRSPPQSTDFRRYLYGLNDPREDPDHVKRVHQQHIDDVRAFAVNNNIPFLEVCFEERDGWELICPFLGKAVPRKPFPWSNRDPGHSWKERLRRGRRKMARRIRTLTSPNN